MSCGSSESGAPVNRPKKGRACPLERRVAKIPLFVAAVRDARLVYHVVVRPTGRDWLLPKATFYFGPVYASI